MPQKPLGERTITAERSPSLFNCDRNVLQSLSKPGVLLHYEVALASDLQRLGVRSLLPFSCNRGCPFALRYLLTCFFIQMGMKRENATGRRCKTR